MSFNIPGADISYYQGSVNFRKMKDYGFKFLILRCGYKDVKDTKFDEYMTQSSGLFPVSVYHYYDPLVDPVKQANKVIQTLAPYKSRVRRVWGDLEFPWTGAYIDPKHWKTYRDIIKAQGYLWGWYTRATWWDSRVGTYAAEFAKDPVWAAQYNTALTLIPKGWTKAHIWQQGTPSIGIAAGVSTQEIDYNLWNDEFDFATEWGTATPPADVVTYPHNGMKQITGTRNGWKFHLFVIDPNKFDIELVSTPNLETVPSVARRKGATLAVNAGEWVRETLKPQDWTVSNGQEIVTRDKAAARPSLQIANGLPLISHLNSANVLQAFTGLRYLLGSLANSSGWSTEGHARTCFGLDAAGNIIVLVSEGVYPNQGVTLFEARDVLQQYGAVIAFDGGGGGDTGGVLDGVDLVTPENIINGQNVYRALPMTLCFYAKGATMDGTAKEKYGSQTRVRKTPSRYGEIVRTLAGYAEVNFTEKVATIPQGTADKAGEMWLKLTDGNFVNYKLFNSMNMLTDYFSILQEPSVTPPPATGDISLDMTLKADGSIVGTWKNI